MCHLKDIKVKKQGFEKSGALQTTIFWKVSCCILGKMGWQSLLHGLMNLTGWAGWTEPGQYMDEDY